MTVYDYLQKKFGTELPQVARIRELSSIDLDTHCGNQCGQVINACSDFLHRMSLQYPKLMSKGGDFRDILRKKVTESAIETCLIYVLG